MQVIDSMTRTGVSVGPDATVMEAAKLMEQRRVGSVVVVDHGLPIGFVTDRDLVRRCTARRLHEDDRVDTVMSSPPVTVEAGSDIAVAAAKLGAHEVRHLVVTQDGEFVGVITERDLLAHAG